MRRSLNMQPAEQEEAAELKFYVWGKRKIEQETKNRKINSKEKINFYQNNRPINRTRGTVTNSLWKNKKRRTQDKNPITTPYTFSDDDDDDTATKANPMMATPQSPTRMFNGLSEDDALYSDAKYAHEINDKMRVPKRIRATGEFSDEDLLLSNQNGMMNSWNYHDKIDMNVPDRIVVLGHEQHLGTRSAPREILLENSILPKDPGFVRVATPPRVITLNEHHFPSASDQNSPNNNGNFAHYSESPPPYIRSDASIATVGFHPNRTSSRAESDSEAVTTSTSGGIGKRAMGGPYTNDMSLVQHREGTPNMGELTPPEEILYLRRQLAKLNRRVLSIEIDNVQRSQREKIVYCMGLAYFLLKAIFWLNRN